MAPDTEFEILDYVEILHVTDQAALFDLGNGIEVWCPLSVVDPDDVSGIEAGIGAGEVHVERWWYAREVEGW